MNFTHIKTANVKENKLTRKKETMQTYVIPHRRNTNFKTFNQSTLRRSPNVTNNHISSSKELYRYKSDAYSKDCNNSNNDNYSDYSTSFESFSSIRETVIESPTLATNFKHESTDINNFDNIDKTNKPVIESMNFSDYNSANDKNFQTYKTASDLSSECFKIIGNLKTLKEEKLTFKSPLITENSFSDNYKPKTVQNVLDFEESDKNDLSNLSTKNKNINNNVVTEEINGTVVQKLLNLANIHVNKGFKSILHEYYKANYGEQIPINILQAINFSVVISKKFEEIPSSTSTVMEKKNTKNYHDSSDNKILVKIEVCKSVTEIWGKLMNSNNLIKLNELLRQMKEFYVSEKLETTDITEGGFYIVFKNHFWHRVKCLRCYKSFAVVLFIDKGDEASFPLTEIYKLHQKFVSLPAQAIKMQLPHLQVFSDCDETLTILKDLLNEKTVFADSSIFLNQEENDCLSVELYLDVYGEHIGITDIVIEQLMKTVLNPIFTIEKEEMVQLHISHMTEKSIFIQLIDTKSFQYFRSIFKDITTRYLDNKDIRQYIVRKLENHQTYLVQNPENKEWFRVKILKYINENNVNVLLIDTGANMCLNNDNFIHLEKLSSVLAKYPKQAIEVQIDQYSYFSDIETLERLRKLVYNKNRLYARFIKMATESNTPIIRLFKKASDNLLTPVNDHDLLFNKNSQDKNKKVIGEKQSDPLVDEMFQIQARLKMREMQRFLSLLSLSSVLDPPSIPKDFCDIHIVIANNPSKFVIQPLRNKSIELKKLDCELSKACESYVGQKLNFNSLKKGELYASKYDVYSNKWYRVYLLQVIDMKIAKVYYCDYGYYKDVYIDHLQPLTTQYRDLPYQAIWAELYGIKSLHTKWTLDDVSRFKDLVQSKNFVSVFRGKKLFKPEDNDKLMPITVEIVYQLELIDTSVEEDIYISDILVNEGRAVRI